jgi:2-keto-4-pentenoate hydratase/2-oxohepta-3-ene-1,7-dioic acid hydratase in catechol pathway
VAARDGALALRALGIVRTAAVPLPDRAGRGTLSLPSRAAAAPRRHATATAAAVAPPSPTLPLKLVAFSTAATDVRPGVLLPGGADVLDCGHAALDLPAARHPLDVYDLDSPLHRTLRTAVARAISPGETARLRAAGAVLARADVTLHAPIPRPGKIVCVALNYRDHPSRRAVMLPERPVLFAKFPSSVLAPGGTIRIPRGSTQVDFEAELGVVIGRRASRVPEHAAMQHVLGFCNFHDVTARDFQVADGQWQRAKSCDTFAPFGEFVATADEIPDPHALRIQARVNGRTMQDANTGAMVWRVPVLIASISEHIVLEPGDIVATGTPPGCGFTRKPQTWLQPGDVCEIEIEGLGVLRNPVAAAD